MNNVRNDLRGYVKMLLPPILESPVRKIARAVDRDWHKRYVGGLWEESGRAQFEFLVGRGLAPESRLLDVGCGSLRGGVHFIRYLEAGNYFGVDVDPDILEAGGRELEKAGLSHKRPILEEMHGFEFGHLGREFEFMLAQGVFTMLPLNDVIRCIWKAEEVLAPGGIFYASFYESSGKKFELSPMAPPAGSAAETTRFEESPFHYSFEIFEWVCEGTSLIAENLGEFGHPRGQHMAAFRRG